MSEAETVWMRGEGGSVIAMDLPLPHMIAQRVNSGEIVRVNKDGSDYVVHSPSTEFDYLGRMSAAGAMDGMKAGAPALTDAGAAMAAAEPEAVEHHDASASPKPADNKAAWVGYAESKGMSHDEADGHTKAQLVEKFGR
jgi:hypothetical protein